MNTIRSLPLKRPASAENDEVKTWRRLSRSCQTMATSDEEIQKAEEILGKAKQLDELNRVNDALKLYRQGVDMLQNACISVLNKKRISSPEDSRDDEIQFDYYGPDPHCNFARWVHSTQCRAANRKIKIYGSCTKPSGDLDVLMYRRPRHHLATFKRYTQYKLHDVLRVTSLHEAEGATKIRFEVDASFVDWRILADIWLAVTVRDGVAQIKGRFIEQEETMCARGHNKFLFKNNFYNLAILLK